MKTGECKAFAKRLLRSSTRPADRAANDVHVANCPECQWRQDMASRLERLGAEARSHDLSDTVLRDTRLRAAEILAAQAQHDSTPAYRFPLFRWPWPVASLAMVLALIVLVQTRPPVVEVGPAPSATVVSDMDRDIHALHHRLALDMDTFGQRHLAPPAYSETRAMAGRLRSQLDRLAFSITLDMPDAFAPASFIPRGTP